MARVEDLWHVEVPDPANPGQKIRKKTAKHPDNGGSKAAERRLAVWVGRDGKEKTKAFRTKPEAGRTVSPRRPTACAGCTSISGSAGPS